MNKSELHKFYCELPKGLPYHHFRSILYLRIKNNIAKPKEWYHLQYGIYCNINLRNET